MNLICGINPVLEALAAGARHFDRLLIVKGTRNRRVSEAISRASQMGIPLRFEPREALDRMAQGLNHQGLIAVVSALPVLRLEDLVAAAREPALFVVLDGVEDPRNLGAILRTAEAAGVDGVLLPERRSAALSETVARTSAGALDHVRVARVKNVAQALGELKQHGLWVVGLDAAGQERWDAIDLKGPVALVLGGEGRGLRRLVRETCDHVVSLPLFGHVSSLNVSVAAGIVLYETLRQRGAVPSQVKPIPLRPLAAERPVVGPSPEDAEEDPGARGQLPTAGAGEGFDEDEEQGPRFLFHEEEIAWAGPSLVPVKRGPRARRTGGRAGRPPGPAGRGGRGPTGDRREGPEGPGPARRRRRRRRPRPQAGPGGPETPAPAVPAEAPADGTPGERKPGRRRRRRRRR